MAIAQTGVNMNFTANTAAAQAQIAALEKRLATLQGLMGKRVRMAAFDTSGFDVRINSQVRAMDELTKRIQKGTITSREFNDTLKNRNGLLEYQQKLARATSFSSMSPMMKSGQMIGSVDTRAVSRSTSALREGAVAMSTYAAAAEAYGRQVMNVGKNMAFMGRQALLSVTGPIALVAAGSAAAFYQYDKQLTNIVKLSGDSTQTFVASNDKIRESAMDLARGMSESMGVTIKQSLDLQGQLIALGKQGTELSRATESAGRLMVLGDLDPDTAIKFTNTMSTVFKASADEVDKYIDLINEMENSTVLTMQDVSDAMPKIGPIVKSMNGDIKDVLVMLEGLKRGGIDAVEGANAVKSITGSVFRSTKRLRDAYSGMVPGDSWDDLVKRNGSNLINILKDLGKTMEDWDVQDKLKLFYQIGGKEQAARLIQLTDSLATTNEQVTKTLAKSEEELRQIANREVDMIMESTSKKFQVQVQRALDFAQKIGSKVLPPIVDVMTKFFDILGASATIIGNVMDALGPVGDVIAWIGKASIVALAGFGPLLLAISALAMIRGAAILGVGKAVRGLSAGMNRLSGGPFSSPKFITMQQRAQELAMQSQQKAQSSAQLTTQQLTASIDKLTLSYERMAVAAGVASRATTTTATAQRGAATIANNPAMMPANYRTNNPLPMVIGNDARSTATVMGRTPLRSDERRRQLQQERSARLASIDRLNNAPGMNLAMVNGRSTSTGRVPNAVPSAASRQSLRDNFRNPTAPAAALAQATAAQEKAAASANKWGMAIGGVTMAASLLTTTLGGTSQMAMNISAALGVAAMAGMMFPSAVGGAVVKGFGMMKTGAINAVSAIATKTGPLGAKIAGSLTGAFTGLGTSIAASAGMLVGFVALVAAIGVAAYAVHRAITADSRAYQEQLEKNNKSLEAHAEILGFTALEYGQVKNEAGEVEETIDSLAKKYKENDIASGGLIKTLQSQLGGGVEMEEQLTLTLAQESIKIKARGGSQADVDKMVAASLIAAGADKATIERLTVKFKQVDFDMNIMLGQTMQDQIKEMFSGKDMSVSGGDLARGELTNAFSWLPFVDSTYKVEGDLSDAAPELIKSKVEAFVTQFSLASEEQKPKMIKMWNDMIMAGMNSEDPKAKGVAKNVAKQFLQGLSESDPGNFGIFGEGGNASFVRDAADMTTALGLVGKQFENTKDATDFYNQALGRLAEGGQNLDVKQKGMLINILRAANGWKTLDGNAEDANSELGKAIGQGNIGPQLAALTNDSNNAAGAVGGLAQAGEQLEDMTVNWDIVINVDGAGGLNGLEMTLGQYKEAMQKTQSDMFDAANRLAQESFDATMTELKAAQDASLKALDEVGKQQEERAKQAEKAMDKAQDLESKAFDKGWEDREKAEKKMFEDRIKSLEDVGEKEDELERQRQRNAERESARLRYLAQLANNNVDMNMALASGDMDTASKLSINQGVGANDFAKETEDREAGYRKDDSDRARKTAIDLIKEEEEARMEMLKNQKEQERTAMEERFAIQKEEFQRKRELEQADLAAKKEAMQAEFAAKNANEQAMFAANQRRMQMELDTLRATLPRTTEEMNNQKAQIEGIYARYGIQLQAQGTEWSNVIGRSLEFRMQEAQNKMADERAWADFGQRVMEGISKGSFNMSSPEFNTFLRTGVMPGVPAPRTQGSTGFGGTRHGGGPVSSSGGYDKYNSRGGIPKSAPMRRNETMLLAKKDEYVVRGAAHKKYGTDFMNKLNSGTINPNVIRHDGGPIEETQSGQASTVRHDGGPMGIGGLGAAVTAAGIGAIISRVSLATGKAMQQALASGSYGGEYIGAGAAAEAIAFAKRESGKPYQYGGGGDPSWDCSGFLGAIWKILIGRNPLGRVFSTEDFRNGGGTKFGFAPGLDPDFPNGFSLGFYHGPGGGANSHAAGTLLGANVESGGTNGVQYGPKAWGANNPYFNDFWHLPGVSGKKVEPANGAGPDTSQYNDWTTYGIEQYAKNVRELYGAKDEGGGGALGDVQTGNREFYIKEIVDEVKRRGMSKKAAVIALMTAMQESSLLMYANSNVPASLALPHDAVGSDHDSVGLFQQRGNGAWGSLQQRMNARASAGAFLAALARFNYENMNENDAAQKVQVSGTPLAYGKWKNDATAQANRYFDRGGEAAGKGFFPKDTLRPERVLSPEQTQAFNSLVASITGSGRGITGFKPIVKALKSDSLGLVTAARNAEAEALNKSSVALPPMEFNFINKGNISSEIDLRKSLDQFKEEIFEELKQRARLAERKVR